MSSHIWKTKVFSDSVTIPGITIFNYALKKGAPFQTALTFVGYVLERVRQGSRPIGYWSLRERDSTPAYNLDEKLLTLYWNGVENSNHRYSKGKNGHHYLDAGTRIIRQAITEGVEVPPFFKTLAPGFDLEDPDERLVAADYLEEHGEVKVAEFLRSI